MIYSCPSNSRCQWYSGALAIFKGMVLWWRLAVLWILVKHESIAARVMMRCSELHAAFGMLDTFKPDHSDLCISGWVANMSIAGEIIDERCWHQYLPCARDCSCPTAGPSRKSSSTDGARYCRCKLGRSFLSCLLAHSRKERLKKRQVQRSQI